MPDADRVAKERIYEERRAEERRKVEERVRERHHATEIYSLPAVIIEHLESVGSPDVVLVRFDVVEEHSRRFRSPARTVRSGERGGWTLHEHYSRGEKSESLAIWLLSDGSYAYSTRLRQRQQPYEAEGLGLDWVFSSQRYSISSLHSDLLTLAVRHGLDLGGAATA